MRGLAHHRLVSVVAVVAMILLATAPLIGANGDAQPASSGPGAVRPALSASSPGGMYAYYYLWWDTHHWQTTLGPNYPFGQSPLPLPATLDAGGCNPTSLYRGNIETDAPAALFTAGRPLPGDLRRPERHRRRSVRVRRGLVRHRLGHPDARAPTARTSGSTCWSRRSTRPRPRGTTSISGSPTRPPRPA